MEKTYDIENDTDEQLYMEDVIEMFNDTLRKGEKPRELIGVKVIDNDGIQQHQFEKSNLVTVTSSSGMYDTFKCKVCGVTGRRYGIGGNITRDTKFKANCYANCTSTLEYLRNKNKK